VREQGSPSRLHVVVESDAGRQERLFYGAAPEDCSSIPRSRPEIDLRHRDAYR